MLRHLLHFYPYQYMRGGRVQHTPHTSERAQHTQRTTDAEEIRLTFLRFLVGADASFSNAPAILAFDLSLRGVAEHVAERKLASGRQVDVRTERRVSLARAAFKKRCVGKE